MNRKIVLAIDPGNVWSAYVLWDGEQILKYGKITNQEMLDIIDDSSHVDRFCVEKVASYGMAVGQTTFDTCVWAGRFLQKYEDCPLFKPAGVEVFRRDVKRHHCNGRVNAKDSNIITALVDRFEPHGRHGKYGKGTKKDPGLFFGISADTWQAFALAVYYYDIFINVN